MNGVVATGRNIRLTAFITVAVFAALSFLLLSPAGAQSRDMEIMEAYQNTARRITRDVLPVVVEVQIRERVSRERRGAPSPLDFFFGENPGTPGGSSGGTEVGSGVIVRRDGRDIYVLTSERIAGSATAITIGLHDGREYEGRLLGVDGSNDLAVVAFETGDAVPVAALGDSDTLQVGDFIFAFGNPRSYGASITSGIVSARGEVPPDKRDRLPVAEYIKTDAMIPRSNSEAPLSIWAARSSA